MNPPETFQVELTTFFDFSPISEKYFDENIFHSVTSKASTVSLLKIKFCHGSNEEKF